MEKKEFITRYRPAMQAIWHTYFRRPMPEGILPKIWKEFLRVFQEMPHIEEPFLARHAGSEFLHARYAKSIKRGDPSPKVKERIEAREHHDPLPKHALTKRVYSGGQAIETFSLGDKTIVRARDLYPRQGHRVLPKIHTLHVIHNDDNKKE